MGGCLTSMDYSNGSGDRWDRDDITPKRRQGLYLVYKWYDIPANWVIIYYLSHPLHSNLNNPLSLSGSTIRTLLHDGINPKDCQVLWDPW